MLEALLWLGSGLFLSVNVGALFVLGVLDSRTLPIWVAFLPLSLSHAGAALAHLRSFDKLRMFLFVPPPPGAPISRDAWSQSRREKFPLALLWLRGSVQLVALCAALVCSELLLVARLRSIRDREKHANGHERSAVLGVGVVLLPLTVFAALNVVHGLLFKGGSWVRLGAAKATMAQLVLVGMRCDGSDLVAEINDAPPLSLVLPSLLLGLTLLCQLARHLSLFHLDRLGLLDRLGFLDRWALTTRAIGAHQAATGWAYAAGIALVLRAIVLFAESLQPPQTPGSSRAVAVCLAGGMSLLLLGIWAAAWRCVGELELFAGDEAPLPLRQDPETGSWHVEGEGNSECNSEDDDIEAGSHTGAGCSDRERWTCTPCFSLPQALSRVCSSKCLSTGRLGAWWPAEVLVSAPLLGPHPHGLSYAQLARTRAERAERADQRKVQQAAFGAMDDAAPAALRGRRPGPV